MEEALQYTPQKHNFMFNQLFSARVQTITLSIIRPKLMAPEMAVALQIFSPKLIHFIHFHPLSYTFIHFRPLSNNFHPKFDTSLAVCDDTQNLNETESETFSRYQFFPIPNPILFSIPNFFDAESNSFLILNFSIPNLKRS